MDIFERTILCKKCEVKMERAKIVKNAFHMRGLVCPFGHDKIIHPDDLQEYEKFKELRGKDFKVKMRIVGNSYAVSIPKEIVSFIHEQNEKFFTSSKTGGPKLDQEKILNDMVNLCFEDAGRVTLRFNNMEKKDEQ